MKKVTFEQKIKSGEKKHTIRQNFPLWEKRAKKINAGLAVLSLRKWTGKPYRSKMLEICQIEQIGVQSIFESKGIYIDGTRTDITWTPIAKNDGLNVHDFYEWFHGSVKELNAVMHFTGFRY